MTTAPQRPQPALPVPSDVLVLDYLATLWAVTDQLPDDVRDELMTAVAEQVAFRRGLGEQPQDILDRLGRPTDLAAAAGRGRLPLHLLVPVAPAPTPPPSPGTGVDVTAVVLLTVGAVLLPGVAPLAGMLLASGSPRWSAAQKSVLWALTGGSLFSALVLALTATASYADPLPAIALLVLVAGPLVSGLALLPDLARRRSAPGR